MIDLLHVKYTIRGRKFALGNGDQIKFNKVGGMIYLNDGNQVKLKSFLQILLN